MKFLLMILSFGWGEGSGLEATALQPLQDGAGKSRPRGGARSGLGKGGARWEEKAGKNGCCDAETGLWPLTRLGTEQ